MHEIEHLIDFKPFRLDWTKEDIRKQIFYKSGHHVGHIKVYPDGSFDKTCDAYKVIKYLIDNVYCPNVKKVSWGDIKNSKLLNLDNFSLNYQCSSYLKFIPDYYTLGINMNKQNTKTEEIVTNAKENGSNFYHGCKGHWLLHDIKENGLNQPIQGVLTRSQDSQNNYYMHIHPGSVRQGVFGMTDDESNTLIVWDAYDAFDWIKPLEVDDWIKTFTEPQFDGKRPTEIHVNYNYANIELQCSGEYDDEGKAVPEKPWREKVSDFSKKVSKLFNGKPLNIYIGYDSRHEGIEDVQIESIRNTCSSYVKDEGCRFEPEIKLLDVSKIAEYNREYANQSTEFTYSRFLIPYLENYEGFSIFVDNDFIWTKPWWEMFYFLHPDNAVACVQYEYELEKMSKVKMGGEENVMYPKKLWSSFMVFNNAHEDCKKLTPEVVNTQTGKYLHQFEWTDKIDRIPDKYIFTEGMSDENKRFNAVHYTRGGPWIKDMDCSEIQKLEVYEKVKNKLNK
tara:strand:- start:7274 stop:8788 length:1515 start_codon:yes stop_codon:yes gene_type:complete